MPGHRNFNELAERFDARPDAAELLAEARARHEAEDAAYVATLAELRRALRLTQAQLAQELELSQAQVSRIEHQEDLFLSTLERYIAAMGGELELVGRFGGEQVTLSLRDLAAGGREVARG